MDIRISNDDVNFKFRVSGMIMEDKKILFVEMNDSGVFCLPGGHVALGENTYDAVIRELEEETEIKVKINKYLGVMENFFKNKNDKVIHEIGFYYLMELEDKADLSDYVRMEDDHGKIVKHNFKWIAIDNLDNYNIMPKELKEMIKNNKLEFNHMIINDR